MALTQGNPDQGSSPAARLLRPAGQLLDEVRTPDHHHGLYRTGHRVITGGRGHRPRPSPPGTPRTSPACRVQGVRLQSRRCRNYPGQRGSSWISPSGARWRSMASSAFPGSSSCRTRPKCQRAGLSRATGRCAFGLTNGCIKTGSLVRFHARRADVLEPFASMSRSTAIMASRVRSGSIEPRPTRASGN